VDAGAGAPDDWITAVTGTQRKVLVFGDDTRSFLATVRSLGRGGLEVHAAPFRFQAPALKSRYISHIHWLPYYVGDGKEWIHSLGSLLDRETFQLVIPCDERTLMPLHEHRELFQTRTCLAIPEAHNVEIFFDKDKTRKLAQELGVPVSPGRLISDHDTPTALIAEVGLPLAVKPCSSYTLDRLYSRNRVIIADDEATLVEALDIARETPHFFEAFFSGYGVGVSVLASRGRVLQAFEHRRVFELQGTSHYRVSEELTPPLIDAVTKMIDGTNYTGVAMFEFRINPATRRWILLEVNARPWGSLPLPVALGVDFPYRWYRLLVDGTETPAINYRAGIFGRNLVPDARYRISHISTLRKHPLRLATFLRDALSEYTRALTGREVHDVMVADDPAPGWREISQVLLDLMGQLASKIPGFWLYTSGRDRRLLRRSLDRNQTGIHDLVFVCQGNVCRSPLAAALLRRALAGKSNSLRVHSSGNLPRAGATSPLNAINAAVAFGIDLRPHRSRHFTRRAAERASVIVVFDDTNRRWIKERYPKLAAPVVMLSSFGPNANSKRTIADPDGRDLAAFKYIYDEIASAVAGLAEVIRESRNV
jgi:protein-tyrosine-phosphatase/predicted ATP-grasp superfamily ATP-dependent carboligase